MLKGIKTPEDGERTKVKPGPVAYLHIPNFIFSSHAVQIGGSSVTLGSQRPPSPSRLGGAMPQFKEGGSSSDEHAFK